MDPEFITYQKFNDEALANELAQLIDDHDIQYYIQRETSGFDPSLVMSNAPVDYAVKIRANDFEKVNQLQKDHEAKNIEGVDKDYYLFNFTDDELMEVITKPDEWSVFDNVLAQKIFAERGKTINEETISAINEHRIEELKTPEPPQTLWITLGYLFAFGGGVLGLFIGWHLKSYKKTLPNGEKVYGYREADRGHGKKIFYIAIVGTIVGVIFKLWRAFHYY